MYSVFLPLGINTSAFFDLNRWQPLIHLVGTFLRGEQYSQVHRGQSMTAVLILCHMSEAQRICVWLPWYPFNITFRLGKGALPGGKIRVSGSSM